MTQAQATKTLNLYLKGLDKSVNGKGFGREHLEAYNLIVDALIAYKPKPKAQ
jgi:hypothetical protein